MASSEKEDKNPVKRIPFLIQIYGQYVNKKYRLWGPSMVIGRHPKSNIKIDSLNVSRSHCTLNCAEGKWSISDNNSQNGTYVNGRLVEKNKASNLQIGDIIFLGPPAENPEAFIFDDYLDEIEYVSSDPVKETVPQSKGACNDSYPTSTASISSPISRTQKCCDKANVNTSDFVPEIKDVSEGISKKDLEKKNEKVNAAFKDQELNASSTSNQFHSTKTPSSPNVAIDGKIASKDNTGAGDVQVEEISQSLLDAESDMLAQDSYPFSLRLDESTEENVSVKVELDQPIETKVLSASQEADREILKSKLDLLSEEIKQLVNSKSNLLKEYEVMCEKNKMLDQKLEEQQKLKEDMQLVELRIKNKYKTQIMEQLEEELICNICTEVLIKPTVLDCSHTFCEHCILQWKKKKRQCPVCRNQIQSQTRVLALDHFIDKALDTLTPDQKEKRKLLMFEREQAKNPPKIAKSVKKRRRSRVSSYRRRPTPTVRNILFPSSVVPIQRHVTTVTQRVQPTIEVSDLPSNSSAIPIPIAPLPVITAPTVSVPEILLSSDSDDSSNEDMFADPCYNCGRYGHVSYECPG